MNEIEFIKYLAKKFRAKRPVVKGIGDDCAILEYTKDKYMLLTCDMIIEGTHFTANATGFQIGWKGVAVNMSDIAAMGGVPRYALTSVGIPRKKGVKFLKEIVRGIKALCDKIGVTIIGGDTNASQHTVLDVTMIGDVEKRRVVKRDGAKVGDFIFVTGALGEGKRKHLEFMPRIKEARVLAENFKINSMIDLSDGLAMDLNRITEASRVGARIYKSLIPLSEKSEPLGKAISTGEDFELLFTASAKESKKIIKRMGAEADLPITLIGEVVSRRLGIKLVGDEGKSMPFKPKGYLHL
jgi:thiamine-monophosphate kinase